MDETVDQISDLPPSIIHHIMTYLSAKEVTRTSILSTSWNQFQNSFPILDFDLMNFIVRIEIVNIKFLEKFIMFVDTFLHQFSNLKVCMQKLRIYVCPLDVEGSSPLFDKWIELATENGLEVLDFMVIADENTYYALPQTIFSAKLLTSLKLVGCKLELPSFTVSFLKAITLQNVYINDQMVQSLICGCPLLEDLFFGSCFGLKFLCISGAYKLKILMMKALSYESVEILAPSLQELTLSFFSCAHLKKLLLSEFPLNDRELHHLISKCPLLEDLSISHCHSLGRIMISSNKLEHLLISSCYGLNALDVDAPRLLSFIFDLNPIPIISTNALCPWNVTLDCDSNLDCDWFLSLKEFLGASSQIERLCIDFSSVEVVFNLDELRRCYPSLPLQVETMDLCVSVEPSKYEILLDGIFCICNPRNLIFFCVLECERGFVTWLFDRLQNRNTNCCNDLHIKCWRHYLKDVKVEQFEPIRGCEINVDELMDRGFMIPKGELWLRLDWCFPVLGEKL
ncbi:putative F-box/FBD/LRR-repeat protein [Citrus sinensis]|nr:putative F-box/FBD/LRR-repeat protein [Citrus sinensis]